MRLSRRLAAGPVLALVLLAGCGGATDPSAAPSADTLAPAAAVQAAADTTQSAGAARIELTSDTKVGEQTVSFTGTGAIDNAARRGMFSLDVPEAGGVIEQRIVDDTVYLALPQEKDVFYAVDVMDIAGTAFGGSSDPSASFQALRGVSDDVREVGTETVRDVETTHYTGTLDIAAALEQAQGPAKSVLESTLGMLDLSSVPFEVYLDDQGRVRRFVQVIEIPAGPQTGGQPVVSTTTVDVFDFGTTVEVEAPPAEQVRDGAPLLQALQGGPGGGPGGEGQPAPAPTG